MIYKNAELYNVRALLPSENGEGFWMSRLPEEIRKNINPRARQTAFNGCGCEIRFNLLGDKVKIVLRRDQAEGIQDQGVLEIYHGSIQSSYEMTPHYVGNGNYEIIIENNIKDMNLLKQISDSAKLPFDPCLIRVLLPFDWRCTLVSLEGEISPPAPDQTPVQKLLAYGSSITHGGSSLTPSGTYAMKTASKLGMDLLNLGFAGSAMLEQEIAGFIAENSDWDIALLELGVNVLDAWSIEQFAERAEQFISTIAEQNKDKWIFCTDIFTMKMDLEKNNKVEYFRSIVKNVVEQLKLPKLIYFSGKEIFPDASLLSSDLVHPSAKGMEAISSEMAKRISSVIYKTNEVEV